MKKNIVPILMSALILLQVLSLTRMGEMQKDLQNTRNELANLQSNQSSQINSIYSNIDSMLKRQASIIDSYDYSLGKVDAEDLTVPVTFHISPKETTTNTTANLYVSGKTMAMSKHGTTFTATLPVDIFHTLEAKIVLSDDGVQRTEKLEVNENLREHVLPMLYVRPEGESGGGYTKKPDELSGAYHRKGSLSLEVKPAQNNHIEKARLVIDIDGNIVSEDPVHIDNTWTDFNENITLSAGETLTMSVLATDSLGLIHKVIIDKLTLGENADPINGDEFFVWMGNVIIMDKEGKVLYEPLYDKFY